MDFKMVPYTEVDGIPMFKDSQIMNLFDRMEKDGTVETVFFNGCVKTREGFLSYMKSKSILLFVFMVDYTPVGFTWLNNIQDRSAQQHLCMFKEFWGRSLDVGIPMLRQVIEMKDNNDEYIFDLLTTIVPAWNKKVINFLHKIGAIRFGSNLPNAIWNDREQRSEEGVMFYFTRGDYEGL